MNKYSLIFYNNFYSSLKKLFDNQNILEIKESCGTTRSEQYRFFSLLYLDENKIINDTAILKYYISIKNDMIFSDHTTAKRTINLVKLLVSISNTKNIYTKLINSILDTHIELLTTDGFLNLHNNHGFDQLCAIKMYHDNIKSVENYKVYEEMIYEHINSSIDYCFINVENSSEYHYYFITQVWEYIDEEFKEKLLNRLFLFFTPKLKLLENGDTKNSLSIDKINMNNKLNKNKYFK